MKKALHMGMLLLLCAFCLSPLLWQLVTSVKPGESLTALPPILPDRFTMEHYAAVLADRFFLRCMANSAATAAMTTILSLAIGSLCAFALAKLRAPFKAAVLAFVLSASMFPPIATVSPLYLIIRGLGVRDTIWALVLTYTSFSLPLSIWILTNFFRQLPDEIYRAARVDGCSPLQCFYRVMLPLSLPGLFTTAILVFIFSWNEFLFALTFTATEASRTVPVAIALFPGVHEIPWGEIAAASVTVTSPLVVLVFAFQKRIVEGLTAGAVKG
ncbi:MAG: carbohydrate ABC transporter permease [Desulfobacteraceae bacterium]|nr:MAG: carbohydrate ABC transporter permease [Desulfobacteraceae bacterium]